MSTQNSVGVEIHVLVQNDVATAECQRPRQPVPIQIDLIMHFRFPIFDLEPPSAISANNSVSVRVQVVVQADEPARIERKPPLPVVHESVTMQIKVGLQHHPPIVDHIDLVEHRRRDIRKVTFHAIDTM